MKNVFEPALTRLSEKSTNAIYVFRHFPAIAKPNPKIVSQRNGTHICEGKVEIGIKKRETQTKQKKTIALPAEMKCIHTQVVSG